VWVSDRWDVEDLANVGSTPVCEKLFCDGPGGLEQPYFRKLFENREYIILETMDMADYALSADISDSGSEGATSDMAECALSTDISDSGSDGATSCSSPFSLPKSKKYLLYKIQSGEGFNLQRNVAMRVAHMMMGLEEAHKYTLVLPPFTNAIHWSDRSTHTFGAFFDLEILREAVDVIELEGFLSDRVQRMPGAPSVDTVVHLSINDDLKAPEVVAWQPECTPEAVTSENSGWPDELRVRVAETESPMAPYEGSMLGHVFPFRNLVCLKVRFDMHGKDLASTLSAIFEDSSSVLIDNAARISWGIGEGERHTGHYRLLASMRFKPHVHHAALDFMETRNFSHDFVAVHMRRNDFLQVRPDVPTPAEVGVQVAVVVRNMLLKRDPGQSPISPPPNVSVFVATDAVDLLGDITQLRDSLNASLKRWTGAAIRADVVFFTDQDNAFEDGDLALIDQIICASATDFVGSNSSYFTKTVSEERLLLGKAIPSSYSVLCATGTNENTRCEADCDSCLTCMNGWLPNMSGEMVSLLSSAEMRNQKGLFERYHRVPAVGANEADEAQIDRSLAEMRSGLCFVIMSSHGSPRDKKAGESLRSRLESEKYAAFLLHSDLPEEAQSQGLWTFLPLFRYFSDGGCGDDSSAISWYIFVSPDVSVDADGVSSTLKPLLDASQPLFVGYALQDEKPSICHHYNMHFDFKYPSLYAGFGITQCLLRRLAEDSATGHAFHIDPLFELAKYVQEVAGVTLTNLSLTSTRESYDVGKRKPWDERPAPRSIFVAIKTSLVNHLTRVPIIKRVWTDAAARNGAAVVFYSETRDDSIPTVYDGITNSEEVKGEAKKLMAIFQHAAKVFIGRNARKGPT
jgi:peptide-O-fucosyltransferase